MGVKNGLNIWEKRLTKILNNIEQVVMLNMASDAIGDAQF